VDVLQKLLDPAEGDAAVARALYSADLLEQKTKILPYPPIKDPAVTRERKAKYADGTYLYMSLACLHGIACQRRAAQW
jgi:hypothetical protein